MRQALVSAPDATLAEPELARPPRPLLADLPAEFAPRGSVSCPQRVLKEGPRMFLRMENSRSHFPKTVLLILRRQGEVGEVRAILIYCFCILVMVLWRFFF